MRQRTTKRRIAWAVLAAFLGAAGWAVSVRATTPSGFTPRTLWRGTFEPMQLKNKVREYDWEAELQTEGSSDLFIQSNNWAKVGDATYPGGGTTGWHTHPGFSLILVTAGTVTVYDGDDPTCTGRTYAAGKTFVDPGGSHVHLIRNEGTVEAQTIAVQIIPTAASATGGIGRRIDAPQPANCAVF